MITAPLASSIAVLVYPGCTVAEVAETATRLRNEGVNVHWVGPDSSTIIDQSGLALTPASNLVDLFEAQFDGLIVAGGDPETVMGDAVVRAFVRRCAAQGVVAGICAGVLVLADAGVLDNRRATHNYRAPWAPPDVAAFVEGLFENVIVEDNLAAGVVVDSDVITALPNAAAEFSIAICRSLGLYNDARAALVLRHLKGEFVPELFHRS